MSISTTVPKLLSVAALVLCLVGCVHPGPVVLYREMTLEESQAETKRASQMEDQADLVIDFERPDELSLRTKGQADSIATTERGLAEAIAAVNPQKDLAVVILRKPIRFRYEEPELAKKADEIQAVAQAQGFKRVVFQFSSASGRFFYRE